MPCKYGHTSGRHKSGRCKKCAQKYYLKNQEKLREYQKHYYSKNRKQRLEYASKHKEHRREYDKQRYLKNKEHNREYNKQRYLKSKEHRWEYNRQRRLRHDCRKLLINAARYRAREKGLPFSITIEDVDWVMFCPILGTSLDYSRVSDRLWDYAPEYIPSLDQVTPGGGYIPGNVAVMSQRANSIKNDGSAEEHRKIAEWMDQQKGICATREECCLPTCPRNSLINKASDRAREKELPFSIIVESVDWDTVCKILGIPPDDSGMNDRLWDFSRECMPPLDQLVPGRGYILGT